jgi:hypothetical protein
MSARFALARTIAVVALSFVVASAACSDSDPVNPDPHPNVRSVLVEVVGGGTVTFNQQHIASGTLTIANNSIVAVTFRDDDGDEDAITENPDNFELRVNYPGGNPANLVFTPSPTNPFAGTFTRTTPTTTPMIVQFELYHISGEEPHQDGRWNVDTVVQ